jgi:hypothetical protein
MKSEIQREKPNRIRHQELGSTQSHRNDYERARFSSDWLVKSCRLRTSQYTSPAAKAVGLFGKKRCLQETDAGLIELGSAQSPVILTGSPPRGGRIDAIHAAAPYLEG